MVYFKVVHFTAITLKNDLTGTKIHAWDTHFANLIK